MYTGHVCIYIFLHVFVCLYKVFLIYFVYSQLLSDGSEHHHKTQVVSHQVNPVWNELHVVTSVDVLKKHKFVEFSIWDCSNPAFNSFMGGVILGPTSNPPNRNGCIDSEVRYR